MNYKKRKNNKKMVVIREKYTSFLQEAHIARRVSDTFAQNLTTTQCERAHD